MAGDGSEHGANGWPAGAWGVAERIASQPRSRRGGRTQQRLVPATGIPERLPPIRSDSGLLCCAIRCQHDRERCRRCGALECERALDAGVCIPCLLRRRDAQEEAGNG